jgi:undecaprenyl-diphosphatase
MRLLPSTRSPRFTPRAALDRSPHLKPITAIAVGIAALLWTIALGSSAQASDGVATSWTPDMFQAAVLGMVQGLTEFIPISSTAHLKIVPQALGWGDPGVAFSATIQLGSIVAVLSYFWADLRQVLGGSVRAIQTRDWESLDFRIALGIAIGTLPIIVVGLVVKVLFGEFYDTVVRTSTVVAIVSIVMGLLLGLAEELCKRSRGFEGLGVKDGILVGLAEALAVIPGVSRSGSTMTAGLFLGLDRATAARFSFLLGIPAITLAGLFELKDLLAGVSGSELWALFAGLISAIVFSYIAIAWLIRFLQTQSTWVFVWYRVAFGSVLLVALSQGWITN